ncbi:MAG: GNAT family N-acetyltransferase [Chloroflexi bacterium]|nr:GNAT family N-acetyltransferase [Chloroflexota bacterium]
MGSDKRRVLERVTLQGSHVRLEPLTLQHVPGLVAAATMSRGSYGFTEVPSTQAAMRRYVETALARQEAGTALPFVTINCATGRIVGSTRFGSIEFWDWPPGSAHQRGEDLPDVVEIGWTWLSPEAQRTGINTEAKLLMLTHAFEVWRVHRVWVRTDSRNQRSRTAIERLGARLDGIIRAERMAYDGEIRDTATYSITDAEWPAVKARIAGLLRPS